jgi:hypothetical protein
MKKRFFISCLFCSLVWSLHAQHPVIGGYNVYYGDLHNHSNVSDGLGTPQQAYGYAKNTAHLDFFSLSDHSGFFTSSNWSDIKNQADLANEDGVFTTFYGFEWTADPVYGHVTILNTEDYCAIDPPTDTFEGLLIWLSARPDGFAILNHPGNDFNTNEFDHFTTTPSDQVVGIELWNKDNGFNIYYYNDGFYQGDNNKSYYDEANSKGWKLGALGSGDNHYGTWGTAYPNRMAVLANNLTRSDLLKAIRDRRFYATLDKNIALSFKIGGMEMGSTITPGNYSVRIEAADGDGEVFNQIILYNQDHNIEYQWTLNTSTVDVSANISVESGDYYYIKIRENDGDEAISSPIWSSGDAQNKFPVCSIISPANTAKFVTPADIAITVNAYDPDGSLSKVEFYQDTTRIGVDFTSPYEFYWNDVGTGTFSISAKATDNSGAVTTSASVLITVTGTPITVAADPKSKVYGNPDPILTYHIVSGSLSGSDTFTGNLERESGEDSGNHIIKQGTLSLGSDYTLIFIGANLVINPRYITITADSISKVYGDPEALTYRVTEGSLVWNDTISGSPRRMPGQDVGIYPILQGSLGLDANYILNFAGASMVITPRPLEITADSKTKVYGNQDPELTFSITSGSLVYGDSFSGSLRRSPGESLGTYPIEIGTLSISNNYNLKYIGADFRIVQLQGINVYPNPYTDHVFFEIQLIHSARLIIEIFNELGTKTETVFSGNAEPDLYRIKYTPGKITSKFLIYRITIDKEVIKGRIVHIR